MRPDSTSRATAAPVRLPMMESTVCCRQAPSKSERSAAQSSISRITAFILERDGGIIRMMNQFARFLIGFAIAATAMFAADLTGIWAGTAPGRRGDKEDVAFQ